MKRSAFLAAVAVLGLAGAASAQVAQLYNGNLEEVDPFFLNFPTGWRIRQEGQSEYRMVGDGLLPPAVARSGTKSVRLAGGEGRPSGETQFLLAEERIDQSNVLSPRNWPQYTFNPPSGQPITIGCWFNIPASDPMVGTVLGLKISLIRSGTNLSIYEDHQWLDVDPDAVTPYPGTTIVTLPGGQKGLHTNGQWVELKRTLQQSQIGTWPEPPSNPARASFQVFRTGPNNLGTGSVFVDDLSFSQGAVCKTDHNGSGAIDLLDIFAFLEDWFAGCTGAGTPAASCLRSADFNGQQGVDLLDIFAFLEAWFANSCG